MSTMYFFDDRHISSMSGLMRVPGSITKLGPVFGSVDPESDYFYDPFAGTIMSMKEGGYRAYVSTFGYRTEEPTRGVSVLESRNGLEWREVKLDFHRKERLNPGRIRIDGLPDGFQGYFKQPQVIRPENNIFRMYVWCHGFLGKAAIGRNLVCESEDGYRFKILDFDAPVLYHPCEFGKWGWEDGLIPLDFSSAERPALPPEKMLSLKGMRSNDSVSLYYDPARRIFNIYSVFLMHNPAGNPRQEDRDNARTLLRVIVRRESADGFGFRIRSSSSSRTKKTRWTSNSTIWRCTGRTAGISDSWVILRSLIRPWTYSFVSAATAGSGKGRAAPPGFRARRELLIRPTSTPRPDL